MALTAMNRFDEAKTILREAESRKFPLVDRHRTFFLVALIERDEAEMARQVALATDSLAAYRAFGWRAHALLFSGRFRAAHEEFQRGIQAVPDLKEYAGQWTVQDAEAHALAGQCDEARRDVATGTTISRDNFTLERANRALALCGASSDVAALSAELERRFPEATLTDTS